MRRSPRRPKAVEPSISCAAFVTTSAREKPAAGPVKVVDGRHWSFSRSASFVPDEERAIGRTLTVFLRNAPFRTRSATVMVCSPVHTLLDVGTSAWSADWNVASCGLKVLLVGGRFLTVIEATFVPVQAGKRGSGLLRHPVSLKLHAPFAVASVSQLGSPSVHTTPRGRVGGLFGITPSSSTMQSVL